MRPTAELCWVEKICRFITVFRNNALCNLVIRQQRHFGKSLLATSHSGDGTFLKNSSKYLHTQTHRHTDTHTHKHIYIYIYICVCMYIYINIYKIYVFVCLCLCVRVLGCEMLSLCSMLAVQVFVFPFN